MYGRESQLYRLNQERNDYTLPMQRRKAADRAYQKIAEQLRDKKLMSLREQLIKATKAGDALYQHKITAQIRDYLGEDRETGLEFE